MYNQPASYWILFSALFAVGCTRAVDEIKPSDPSVIKTAAPVAVAETDWPWWRGTSRDGQALGDVPPTELKDELILWRATVPGRGHASPALWGEKIFVATAEEANQTQSLFCFARDDGQLLWQRDVHSGGFMSKHLKNSHASATPACDGRRVFVCFPSQSALWVTAVDMDGKIAWQKRAGAFKPRHGFGSSPLIYRSLLIVAVDHEGASYLVALDREKGNVVWRKARSGAGSYGTPVVASVAGRDQLLLSGQDKVGSYDPATGDLLWSCKGPATVTANTIAWRDNLVYASGGYPQQGVLCIRADGSGDVTSTHVVWQKSFKCYVPSPLVIGDRILFVRDSGIAVCLAADSGDELWQQRLSGNFSASPVAAGPYVFIPNERGRLFVFKAGESFESIAESDLGEGMFASPVICGGRLYLRGEKTLVCYAARDPNGMR